MNSLVVTLLLTRSAHVPEMRIADGSDPTDDSWRPFADSVTWELPDTGQGERVISAQFRSESGVVSPVVITRILYDTVRPTVTVTTPAPGSLVDVSRGELVLASGTLSDGGSEVTSMKALAPDGSAVQVRLDGDGNWSVPIGAPTTGMHTFNFQATDEAGNTGMSPIDFNIKAMPPTSGTVVRPTTWELTAAERSAVAEVSEGAAVFDGDVRAATADKVTMLSAPIPGSAEEGLLRSILSSSFDEATGSTRIVTGPATLSDAFAQFDLETPASAPLASAQAPPASATSGPCSNFVAGKTVRLERSGSWRLSRNGSALPIDVSAAVSATAELAAYADVDLHLQMGWSPRVTGAISVGAMACGELALSADADFDKTLSLPGAELRTCWIVGPIPVCIKSEAGVRINVHASGPKVAATANAGFQATFPVDGSPSFSFPRGLSSTAEAFGGGEVYVGPSVSLKLLAAETVETSLMDFSGGPSVSYDHGSRTAESCVRLSASFTPSLRVKMPLTGSTFTLFEKRFEESLTGLCRQVWPAAPPSDPGEPPPPPPSTPPTQLTGNIAREPDGTSWYVDKRNGTHWIPNGGVYECLRSQGKNVVAATSSTIRALHNYEDAQCVRAAPGDIIRHNDGDAYLVEPDFSRRWIRDGGSFECLRANGHSVVSGVPRYYIDDMPKGADYSWSCWSGAAKGKVVRASDGSSWYVDLRGGRHWIPDGGTYQCIEAQRGAYGNVVPRAWLDSSFPNQYENAQCVRANPGDIIRHNDGDSYVVQSNWTRRWIPNGASYNCHLARGRRVVNGVPRYYVDDMGSGANYSTGESCRLILAHTAGDSHFIDGAGLRHWIPNTTVYGCLSSRYPRFGTSSRTLVDTGWDEKEWATCSM